MRIAVVDTETSGTGPEDRMIEFALVMVERTRQHANIMWGHSALNGEGPPSTPDAFGVHGISEELR